VACIGGAKREHSERVDRQSLRSRHRADTSQLHRSPPAVAGATNGLVQGPTLRWREGDEVTISVTNRVPVDTSIHWYGLRIPSDMDGVGLSLPGIAPNGTFVYRFPVRQSGIYWYHSRSRFQEQTVHFGQIIIEPTGKDPIQYDREYRGAVARFDLPAFHQIKRRRAQRLSRAKTEARVTPGQRMVSSTMMPVNNDAP
jgi:FtsP/CotA-like multicopper oxidase with cupredoxin domain